MASGTRQHPGSQSSANRCDLSCRHHERGHYEIPKWFEVRFGSTVVIENLMVGGKGVGADRWNESAQVSAVWAPAAGRPRAHLLQAQGAVAALQ